jgi:ubiquinone/menaquinone biosynthesis C-methylase UbiE
MREDIARLFDAMADSYDALEPWYKHLYARLHTILRATLTPARGRRPGRALDVGCGTGFQSTILGEIGYEVHGVDISPGLLTVARRRRLPRSWFSLGSAEDLPYAEAAFDVVNCCGSTLSLVEQPERVLREIGRVLRPGGALLLECEHKWSLDLAWTFLSSLTRDSLGYRTSLAELRRQLASPIREGFWLDYAGDGAGSIRLRLFTLAELSAMLAKAGIRLCRRWGLHSVTNVIPSTVLHRASLGRGLSAVYRALCVLDGAMASLTPAVALANSVVILGRREPSESRDGGG